MREINKIEMDPTLTIELVVSIILTIHAGAEASSSNVKTCKLLARRCQDLIPSLKSMNTKRDGFDTSLRILSEVLKSCESFITSHGQKWTMFQFFNPNIIRDHFKLLNDRINTLIISLSLDIQINSKLQLQEVSDALAADMDELKAAVHAIATTHNIKLDQLGDSTVGNNEIVIKYMQSILDEVSSWVTVVNTSPLSLDEIAGTAVRESVKKVPAGPVCLPEYTNASQNGT